MGLVSGVIRLQYLKQREMDLEFKLQELMQTKNELASQGLELTTVGTELDPESPEIKHLEFKKKNLERMEKQLDLEIQKYQTMLKMSSTEMQSAQGIVDNSIKRSFSYGNGG
jgi:predicted nuclease with TOPRIM domain